MNCDMSLVRKQITQHCSKIKATLLELGRCKSSNDTLIKCSCGVLESRSAQAILKSKAGCVACRKSNMHRNQSKARKGKAPTNKSNHKDYVEKLKKANPNIKCLGTYVNCETKILHKCLVCSTEKLDTPSNKLKYGCATCVGLAKKTVDSYNEELRQKGINFKAYEYKGAKVSTLHACTKCFKFSINALPTNMLKPNKIKCPECDGSNVHVVKMYNRFFRVRGYERFAVKQIIKRFGLNNVKCDLDGEVPQVLMRNGTKHRPDFYIPNENLMIEIKSLATMGLLNFGIYGKNPELEFKNIVSKKKAALKMGYRYFLLLISDEGDQIPIPHNWETLSRSKLRKIISKDLGHRLK